MEGKTPYIENTLKIDKLTQESLEKLTFEQFINKMFEFQSQVSHQNPIAICSIPPRSTVKDFSIYNGTGGYLYFYLKLYKYSLLLKENKNLEFYKKNVKEFERFSSLLEPDKILAKCEDLYKAIKPFISDPFDKEKTPMITFFMGRPGILLLLCQLSFYQGNLVRFEESLKELNRILEYTLVFQGEMYHEVLYGSCGLLYCLLVLQKSFQNCEVSNFRVDLKMEIYRLLVFIYRSTVNKTFERLCVTIFGEEYLGAAHGIFGTLYVLMEAHDLISEFIKVQDPGFEKALSDIIVKTCEFCLGFQYPSGNFASSPDLSHPDEMVQYCHGSPGIIPILSFSHIFFKHTNPDLSSRLLASVLKAGEDVWTRGLLKKGFNLCHGISGNAYAFLSLYNLTSDRKWLVRALAFANCGALDDTIEHIIAGYDSGSRFKVGVADHPFGLMEGLAGHLCLLVDLDERNVGKAKFPGLEV